MVIKVDPKSSYNVELATPVIIPGGRWTSHGVTQLQEQFHYFPSSGILWKHALGGLD